jgi:hypothetical protein
MEDLCPSPRHNRFNGRVPWEHSVVVMDPGTSPSLMGIPGYPELVAGMQADGWEIGSLVRDNERLVVNFRRPAS